MTEDFKQELLQKLDQIGHRLDRIENLQQTAKMRLEGVLLSKLRRAWTRPPMWTYEQYRPRLLNLRSFVPPPQLESNAPLRIGIVTPSFNHSRYLSATIDSVLSQKYPELHYHVQDGGSADGTRELLESRTGTVSWSSEPDTGQSNAINIGFRGVQCDIMAYLNSDDVLLPGTLNYIANHFTSHPDIDVVYGHRVFIDREGLEIGRAVLPTHDAKTLEYADYIPQETMFWRKRVWDAIGPIDENFHDAMDWDFILRAQAAGFKFERLPRFLACFRVHDQQKTAAAYSVGIVEMGKLRLRTLGFAPTHREIHRAIVPFVARQFAYHWGYKTGLLKY